MMDFHACQWPSHLGDGTGTELAQHFDRQNDAALEDLEAAVAKAAATGAQEPLIVSFSHYLPFQACVSCHLAGIHCKKLGTDRLKESICARAYEGPFCSSGSPMLLS